MVTAVATDDLSGVDGVYMQLQRPGGNYVLMNYSASSNQWYRQINVEWTDEGEYQVGVRAFDKASTLGHK
jgi:hypothetical protein